PAQNFNDGAGSIFVLDGSGTSAISWATFNANRTGGWSTVATAANSWQFSGGGALAGAGAGDRILVANGAAGTNAFGTRTGNTLFDQNYQIGSERVINGAF